MQRDKSKWRADRGVRAFKAINGIKAPIALLHDEDLLDLEDIFAAAPASELGTLAADEVRRRGLAA